MPFVAYRVFFRHSIRVILEATHIRALQVTTLADLEYHGLRVKELPGA